MTGEGREKNFAGMEAVAQIRETTKNIEYLIIVIIYLR